MRVLSAMGLGLLMLAASAIAGESSEKTSKKDPNRVICEKQEEVGTRLGSKRICHTAAEWDAIRHEARQNLEKAQTNRGTSEGR